MKNVLLGNKTTLGVERHVVANLVLVGMPADEWHTLITAVA